MYDKIILVTGASSGIGKVTALELAKKGHTIAIHGRDHEKTRTVLEEIKQISGNKKLSMFVADLSLMTEVKRFAHEISTKFDHLDVLVNNAGGQFGNIREVTAEGHERTFAINTLSPFLLTKLLLPLLRKSPSGRVVTVSSESYRSGGTPDLDDIELKHSYSLVKSYALSKLYVFWLMREFASDFKRQGINNVTVNCVEPGSAATGLQRISGETMLLKVLMVLFLPFTWSVEKAAATSIHMAESKEVEGITNKFYGNLKEKKIHPRFLSDRGQAAVWKYCSEACAKYL